MLVNPESPGDPEHLLITSRDGRHPTAESQRLDFMRGTMSSPACDPPEDVQVTQSSVLLLLQEATKLAAPAGSGSGETPDSSGSSESSGPLCVVQCERSSAWEVMRLINQQCERLLRSGREEGPVELDSSDLTETITVSRPAHRPSVRSRDGATDACVSFALVYSSELTDLEETAEPEDLAELIKTSVADEVSARENTSGNTSTLYGESPLEAPGECDVLPTESDCPLDFSICLESDSVWRLKDPENTPARPDLNNNVLESLNQQIQDPPSCDAHRRTQRKQPRPVRSPDPQDPDVQGVTFTMRPELEGGADRSRLVITSSYREEIRRLRSSRSSRSLRTRRSSSSEEESDSCGLSRSKICASCRTRKTPLWRDAEDGTPLCNACGIRYKKYRVRCQQCWNIPKKDANTHTQCLRCGDVLKLKSSGW